MPSYFLAETCKYAFLIANSTFLEVRSNSHSTHSAPFRLLASIRIALQHPERRSADVTHTFDIIVSVW